MTGGLSWLPRTTELQQFIRAHLKDEDAWKDSFDLKRSDAHQGPALVIACVLECGGSASSFREKDSAEHLSKNILLLSRNRCWPKRDPLRWTAFGSARWLAGALARVPCESLYDPQPSDKTCAPG